MHILVTARTPKSITGLTIPTKDTIARKVIIPRFADRTHIVLER